MEFTVNEREDKAMLFHTTYQLAPEHRSTAQERFVKTGAMPPEGVKLLGRWHDAGGLSGFMVSDAPGAVDIAKWCQQWTDIIVFEVTPVITDEELASVLGLGGG